MFSMMDFLLGGFLMDETIYSLTFHSSSRLLVLE